MTWLVPLSAAERAAGMLSPATRQAAKQSLDDHGCVLLRGVFSEDAVDRVRAAFDEQWRRDEPDMAQAAKAKGANPILWVGEKRYEVLLTLRGALADPMLFANPLLYPVLTTALGKDMRVSGVTAVVSYPGAQIQHIHADHPQLFEGDAVSVALPSYGINVAVPLIDVDRTIGPTAICLGSHRWPQERTATLEELTVVDFQRGDCVLIDYRTQHTGMPNTSNVVRPILYMVYARNWFFDDLNHRTRPSLHMPLEVFAALPEPVKPLFSRAYSMQMRARYLNQT